MQQLTYKIIAFAQSSTRSKSKRFDKAIYFDDEFFEAGIKRYLNELGVSADGIAESVSELLVSKNEFNQDAALSLLHCIELDVEGFRGALVKGLKDIEHDSELLPRFARACSDIGLVEASDMLIQKFDEVKIEKGQASYDVLDSIATSCYLIDHDKGTPLCIDVIKVDMSVEMTGFYSSTACLLGSIISRNEQHMESINPLLKKLQNEPVQIREYVMGEFSKGINRFYSATDENISSDRRHYMEEFVRKGLKLKGSD